MGRAKKPSDEILTEQTNEDLSPDFVDNTEDDPTPVTEKRTSAKSQSKVTEVALTESAPVEEETKKPRKPRARKQAASRKSQGASVSLLESMSQISESPEQSIAAVVSPREGFPQQLSATKQELFQNVGGALKTDQSQGHEEPFPRVTEPTNLSLSSLEKGTPVEKAIEFFEGQRQQAKGSAPLSTQKGFPEEFTFATASVQTSMENMAKQWITVKEMSTSVCSNLERVNALLKEPTAFEKGKGVPPTRSLAMVKMAMAVSAFSIVVSVVSLLLSQSARQVALERSQFSAPVASKANPSQENLAKHEPGVTNANQSLAMSSWQSRRTTKSIPMAKPQATSRKKKF